MSLSRLLTLASAAATPLIIAGCSNLETTEVEGPPPELAAAANANYAADPAVFDVFDEAVVAAGTDPQKLAELEEDFAMLLADPATTFAGKQAIAQRLGSIVAARGDAADSPALPVLANLLRAETTVEIGRLGLEPVPGEAVDAIFLKALGETTGKTRIAIMQAIGARLISRAVPEIAALLDDGDPATVAMAIRVLGQIDGADALAALEQAPGSASGELLDARLAAASRADPATATVAYEKILRDRSIPLEKRAIALRGILDARPRSAVGQIHEALMASEPIYHQVAVEAIWDLPNPETSAELATNLSKYAVSVQIPVITALGCRGDASAVPGLLEMLDSPEDAVRIATLEALGRLPATTATAERVAQIALGSGDVAKAAAEALSRLDGEGIDELVMSRAAEGDADSRALFIDQLARRGLTEAIPFLLGMKNEPDAKLRLEALDALRAIASPAEQDALIAWALEAETRTESARAVRTLIALTLRNDNVDTRAAAILATMAEGDSATRATLMPVLSRVDGDAALATARSIALADDAKVAAAAVGELARWPTADALAPLVEIAEKAVDSTVSARAIQGAARLIERGDAAERSLQCSLVTRLLNLPSEAATKNRLLVLLRRCADEAAITLAKGYLADEETTAEAAKAIAAIEANLAWPPAVDVSGSNEDAAYLFDGDRNTAWAVPNQPGSSIFLDLHGSRPIARIILDQGRARWNSPANLRVYVSESPEKPAEPAIELKGEPGKTIITLNDTPGRYIWLDQTGNKNGTWNVAELIVE